MLIIRKVAIFIYPVLYYATHPKLFLLKQSGVDIQMLRNLNRPWLRSQGIRTIIDIGANTGQFAQAIHMVIPEAAIYAFEPLPDCFEMLKARMAGVVSFYSYNLALGDKEGLIAFYRSSSTPSSSPRMMSALHQRLYPHTSQVTTIQVPVSRLDTVFQEVDIADNLLIKVDVQGYEDVVIRGGEQLFSKARIVIIEVSFEQLYEEQPSFDQLYQQLKMLGFEFRGALEQFANPLNGNVAFADCIFTQCHDVDANSKRR